MESIHALTVTDIRGEAVPLARYRDKVLLIVNTASECMFTPQYTALQALYERYRERGLVVLGFPCDQFGHQEPGDAEQIQGFCTTRFSVSFPLMDKVEVNGPNAAPLYVRLKEAAPGLLGSEKIKWNFTKFLVDKQGRPVKRFAPQTKPEAIASDLERLLAAH
jgi:glutathione peroxidase